MSNWFQEEARRKAVIAKWNENLAKVRAGPKAYPPILKAFHNAKVHAPQVGDDHRAEDKFVNDNYVVSVRDPKTGHELMRGDDGIYRKRPAPPAEEGTSGDEPPAKSQQQGASGSGVAVATPGAAPGADVEMVEPQAGGGVPGGTGSSQMPIAITQGRADSTSIKFCKTFQVYTAGFRFATFTNDFINPANVDFSKIIDPTCTFLATPLAVVNPNCPEWFISPAEWDRLPSGAYATRVEVKITPLGYRLPFATNEAASTYANSQTLVQIIKGVGINNQMNCFNTGYVADSSELTKITGTQQCSDLTNLLYGQAPQLGCNIGIPRHLNSYLTLFYPTTGNSKQTPNLLQMASITNVNDVKGTPAIQYEYNFKCGVLKPPQTSQYANCIKTDTIDNPSIGTIPEGNNPSGFWTRANGSGTSARGLEMYGEGQQYSVSVAYQTMIEKSPYLSRNYGDHSTPDHPPLITFGVMPVQSNAALAAVPSFADVVAQWEVETCIYITYNYAYVLPDLDLFYFKSWDPQIGRPGLQTGASQPWRAAVFIANRRVGQEDQDGTVYGNRDRQIISAKGTPVLVNDTPTITTKKRRFD